MVWPAIVLSILIALGLALLAVALVGWRRPNAASDERTWVSVLYFALLLFFAVWASSAWLEPWGPTLADVAWLNLVLVGLFVALILIAASPPIQRPRLRRTEGGGLIPAEEVPMEDRPDSTLPAAVAGGFGVAFWLVLFLLLIAAIAGAVM